MSLYSSVETMKNDYFISKWNFFRELLKFAKENWVQIEKLRVFEENRNTLVKTRKNLPRNLKKSTYNKTHQKLWWKDEFMKKALPFCIIIWV